MKVHTTSEGTNGVNCVTYKGLLAVNRGTQQLISVKYLFGEANVACITLFREILEREQQKNGRGKGRGG